MFHFYLLPRFVDGCLHQDAADQVGCFGAKLLTTSRHLRLFSLFGALRLSGRLDTRTRVFQIDKAKCQLRAQPLQKMQ